MRHRSCHVRHAWWAPRIGTSTHPTLRCMGVRGDTPESSGAFFTHLFMLHIGTTSCRLCVGAHPPSGSLRLTLYTPVGQSHRSRTQGWCQVQGAFLRTTRSRVFMSSAELMSCGACPSGSRSASCCASPLAARALLGDGSTLDTRRSGHDHRPVPGGLQTFVISRTVLKMAILLWEF